MWSTTLSEHLAVIQSLEALEEIIETAGSLLSKALMDGHRILVCGNGGSAADAQHFAAELVGRFEAERRGLPAIALTTDTSILTAIGNDYGYERVFSRQVDALGKPGDMLIGISTSGNSRNVMEAVASARAIGMQTIGLLGATGGLLAGTVDTAVVVPATRTARIQEAHILILHHWARCIEASVLKS
uniref:Phosphoheptose isomerase n=1 Tax=Desulfatirhabdium butyrativorans TaxID=340467 RepID=A0A7C4MLS2_9BACT